MNKQTKIVTTVVFIAGIALATKLYTVWPRHTVATPETLPTQQISNKNSIGGTVASSGRSQNSPSASLPNQTVAPTSPPSVTRNNQNTTQDLAPRQTEIKKSVTKEYPYQALLASNDPLTQNSWVLTNTKTQPAWDQSTGSGTVVAVIDTGFALQHEDLINQWYTNSDELGATKVGDRCWTGAVVDKMTNNCDDDNNGYIDDWRGWNFFAVNNLPQAGVMNPIGNGVAHGTEVAGLVGATGNNGKGIATLTWNTKVMPLQVLDDNGSGYTSSVVAAVYYAVDNGAQVINMSLGGDERDPALSQAINYAYNHDVVVIAAAGNCGTGQEMSCNPAQPGAMSFPALDNHVISVGASTSGNARASFSSFGPGLDVMAPGSGTIVSPMWTQNNQTTAYANNLYGTSFASPLVASYVALIKSIRPSTSVDDITAIVDGTAQKLPAMNGAAYSNEYGHGLINAQNALSVSAVLNTSSAAPILLQTGSAQSEHTFAPSTELSSGCTTPSASYCTIWIQDTNGYDRYLPYAATPNGSAGWLWSGNTLSGGEWWVRARSGSSVSDTPYLLFQK